MRICALILAALAARTLDWSGAAHAAAPAAEQKLRSAGLSVQRSKGGRLSLHWQAPAAEG